MSIGFIGLGNLGTAISTRLAAMNEEILVYNRTKKKKYVIFNKFHRLKSYLKCAILF